MVADDTLGQVAARFGITVDDVFSLNPRRTPSPDDPSLYTDEILNLDLSRR